MKSFSENEEINDEFLKQGVVNSEQVLIIKEIFKNAKFTCHAKNQIGSTKQVLNIIVTGNSQFGFFFVKINFFRTRFTTSYSKY